MDAIDRQAAIEAVGYYSLHSGDKLLFADKPLKELPSVQPEIIRCKDCKHYREYVGFIDGCCHMAEWYKRYQYPDDYCSRAERRSDDV